MSKLLSFLFVSAVSPLLPTFLFFIGVKLGYIDYYGISEYYNVIFVDNMPWIAYWIYGVSFGVLVMLPYKRLVGALYIVAAIISATMFIPSISLKVSTKLFAKESFHIVKKPWTYSGVLLYEGRDTYYLLNDENQKTMTFKKEEIDETY